MRKKGSNGQRLDNVERDLSLGRRDLQRQQEKYAIAEGLTRRNKA